MKISIIIPFFRDASFIRGCLEMLSLQYHTDWECLLVDDCGMDGSGEIAEMFALNDNRIKVLRHHFNRGLGAGRNTALSEASGDYVYFMDADDRFCDECSLAILALSATNHNPDWVQSSFHRSNGQKACYGDQTLYKEQIVNDFTKLNFTNAAGKLVRRQFIIDNDLYFTEGLIYEDVEWCMRAYHKVQKLSNTAEPTYFHNLRPNSIMRSVFSSDKVDSLQHIIASWLAAPQDQNTRIVTSYYSLFLLKNLLLTSSFTNIYKHSQYKQLVKALQLPVSTASLPPFTRLLSCVRRSYLLSYVLCGIYSRLKRKKV